MFYELYDDLFGVGTGEKLMGKRYNVRETEKCYNAFLTFVRSQIREIDQIRANTLGNRKERRYNQKKRKNRS